MTPTMLLRRLFTILGRLACLVAPFATFVAMPASAQFRVEISGVGGTQLPVAVAPFKGEDKAAQPVSAIVRADLERSGLFKLIETSTVIDEAAQPAMGEWRARGADALLAGSVTRLADGRYDVRYRLWDVVKGQPLLGQATAVAAADLRLAAHRIADAVYEKLTGEKGVFSTRIAYVTKAGNRFTLRIADADGEGGQVALASPEPIISPTWSPDGRELAYVSFENQKAAVWVQDVSTGKRRMVANFRGSNSAPAWSPDGSQLAVTLSREGGSQIYLLDRNGGNVRRLTTSTAIDTEPVFAPDGKSLYFVSDRGGGPQIYRMGLAGGSPERVTFNGAYNISPALSPDGRTLAYISRQSGAYRLVVQELSTNAAPRTLTDTSADERPGFSPNGRLLVYATKAQGRDVLMTTTLDGRIKTSLAVSQTDVREPVWGPFSR
jgi:TolB protein